jgi:hypothetical protein
MNFDGSLDITKSTSFLQEIQIIEDLVKPIRAFWISRSGASNLIDAERSKFFCRFKTSSKHPINAE